MAADQKRKPNYDVAHAYWDEIPATDSGMLGGLEHLHGADIKSSQQFLKFLIKDKQVGTSRALDCGAGIGRVTKALLLPIFTNVDMVEQSAKFLDQAPTYLGESLINRVLNRFPVGLQDFTPEPHIYDVIWIQWVIGHLTDSDLYDFLKRCKSGLTENGVIVIKDNISNGECDFDEADSSVMRPRNSLVNIIKAAGLTVLKETKVKKFPNEICEVRIFALL